MSEQITITLSKDDIDPLQRIVILARGAEIVLCDIRGLAGNDNDNGLKRLDSALKNAVKTAEEGAVIDSMERQFNIN